MVFVADEEMSFVAVNQYACDVLGYTRSELLAAQITDVSPFPDTRERFEEFMVDGQTDGEVEAPAQGRDHAVKTRFAAKQTTVAGLDLYVWVGFPESVPGAPSVGS